MMMIDDNYHCELLQCLDTNFLMTYPKIHTLSNKILCLLELSNITILS